MMPGTLYRLTKYLLSKWMNEALTYLSFIHLSIYLSIMYLCIHQKRKPCLLVSLFCYLFESLSNIYIYTQMFIFCETAFWRTSPKVKIHRPNKLVVESHLLTSRPWLFQMGMTGWQPAKKRTWSRPCWEHVSSVLLCFVLTPYFSNLLPNTLWNQAKSPLCTRQYISDAQ